MLVYSISAGLIGVGLLEMGLYWAECRVHQQPVQFYRLALPGAPLALGFILLARAKAVARWISDKLDE